LKKGARFYAATLSAEADFWNEYGEKSKNIIRLFPRMKLEQNRPLLLAIFQHFQKPDIESALEGLLAWLVRGLVGGVMGKGAAEKAFCDAAVKIRSGDIKSRDELRDALMKLISGNTTFSALFEGFGLQTMHWRATYFWPSSALWVQISSLSSFQILTSTMSILSIFYRRERSQKTGLISRVIRLDSIH
jgi:hypothetical protein